MKASIRDADALKVVKPPEVSAYLRSQGWKEVEKHQDRYSIWARPDDKVGIELLLPLDVSVRDYSSRMAEVLQVLEVSEGRSQLEILSDVGSISNDVLRIRAEDENFRDGTMPLEHGVALVAHTSELVLAAACGAAQPRGVFTSRKPSQAVDFFKNVRLGQTEYGSYVVTVHIPIGPAPRESSQLQLLSGMEDPFERKVSRTLMRSVSAVRDAAQRYVDSGDLTAFTGNIGIGVSANLCDALVGLQERTGSRQIRLQMRWAPTWSRGEGIADHVVISSLEIPVIKKASDLLRASSPREDFELRGFVTELSRNPRSFSGKVTILGMVQGAARRVAVSLGADDYDDYEEAIRAHQQNLPVRCVGELVREGRRFVLHYAGGFVVERRIW